MAHGSRFLREWADRSGVQPGGRCPPGPLGFIALCLLQQGIEELKRRGGPLPARPTLLFASLQIGARVASPQSPILRWSNWLFPVSVSLGVYRAGKGKRQIELIAFGVAAQF